MKIDLLPDWRVHVAAEIEAVNGLNPSGVQPGHIILRVTDTKVPDVGRVTIPLVSAFRLALSGAIRATDEARGTWKGVRFLPLSKGAKSKSIDFKTTSALFDYFEQATVAAILSYQAIETFANQAIEERMCEGQTLELTHRKALESFDLHRLQREVSTEEKVVTVLPMLVGVRFDKSEKLWQRFALLQRVRDAVIHLKTKDHHTRGSFDTDSVFYRLLNTDVRLYPRTALGVMRHFSVGEEQNWLLHAEERVERSALRGARGV